MSEDEFFIEPSRISGDARWVQSVRPPHSIRRLYFTNGCDTFRWTGLTDNSDGTVHDVIIIVIPVPGLNQIRDGAHFSEDLDWWLSRPGNIATGPALPAHAAQQLSEPTTLLSTDSPWNCCGSPSLRAQSCLPLSCSDSEIRSRWRFTPRSGWHSPSMQAHLLGAGC